MKNQKQVNLPDGLSDPNPTRDRGFILNGSTEPPKKVTKGKNRGVRGSIAVADKHELLLCNYNHSDSYPNGQGYRVIEFIAARLKSEDNRLDLGTKCRNLTRVDENAFPDKATADKYVNFWDTSVSQGSDWYAVLRRLQGANFLYAVMDDKVFHQPFNSDFPKDSLFCEYAYCIDLGRDVLEAYEGLQTMRPPEGNRWGTEPLRDNQGYYPIRLVGEIPLDDIVADPAKAKAVLLSFFLAEDHLFKAMARMKLPCSPDKP